MKYYLIAGEASGDLHGARLIRQLHLRDQDAEVQAWGGDLMAQAGATIKKHYRELAFMGFVEVIQNLRTIFKNIEFCKKDIQSFKPDALILIDYPGFNLRIAQWAKAQGYKVFYYISPQLWAWKADRAKIIKSSVDKLYTILPFENAFYQPYGIIPEYVGHPLLEAVAEYKTDPEIVKKLAGSKILALLPGSRKQEISKMLPLYLRATASFPEYKAVIAAAPSQPIELYEQIMSDVGVSAEIIKNQTYDVLSLASLAWVSSGTATLETVLFGVPQVVCYTGNWISYQIAKRLVKVKYISLVNLILDQAVIPELIQDEFNITRLVQTTQNLNISQIKSHYSRLNQLLQPLNASQRVASSIISSISN